MHFFSLILVFIVLQPKFLYSYKSSDDCSGFFSLENACNSLALEVVQEWPKLKPLPSVRSAKSIGETCKKAYTCMKSLDCFEQDDVIRDKVDELKDLCTGIQTFVGPFGECLDKIRGYDPTRDYPCLKYWNYDDQSPTCEFFSVDYECAEMYIENQCGEAALGAMRTNLGFLLEHFGCSKKSTVFGGTGDPLVDWIISYK